MKICKLVAIFFQNRGNEQGKSSAPGVHQKNMRKTSSTCPVKVAMYCLLQLTQTTAFKFKDNELKIFLPKGSLEAILIYNVGTAIFNT